ncbi:Crp/Fnr family transcriptional regulator [Tenacibaculum sp. TC6]|uniref:Crp/Fnr family transcriptional regulator n=1 Tax=Tenacibaculum sp. TC6 TaxID=3423223 RepID=UPI003D35F82E
MIEIDKTVFSKYPINNYAEIWDKIKLIHFTKKTVLPKDILCFLQKGTIRKSLIGLSNECTENISIDFYFEGDIFTAKTENEEERQFNYEPISDGVVGYVEMNIVRKLFLESKLCSTTQKVFLEERLREKTIREIQLLKSTPEEMYLYLLKNKPHFIQNVPLKYLSSYIGITPQALSRIRKRIN